METHGCIGAQGVRPGLGVSDPRRLAADPLETVCMGRHTVLYVGRVKGRPYTALSVTAPI